ncbi:MAG TPA: tryptophan synthase subunit alpha, partial [Nitrososphaeraceae archaeon]|nr:tryptophan synthase subunit alpha [Nitrososphaeraceae archaeon]
MIRTRRNEDRISKKFSELRERKQAALICYVVGGFPDLRTSRSIIETLVKAGADMIEIGIPFSDPIADGPIIQEASHHALTHGVRPQQCVALAGYTRKLFPELPLIFMTYSNILYRTGFETFMTKARDSGIDGFILPDMSIEESEAYIKISRKLGVSSIFIVSPNTDDKRVRRIMNVSTGFLYTVSVYGVTGVRSTLYDRSVKRIAKLRKNSNPTLPIAVGFGVQKPDHVSMMVAAGADAIIMGSALIKIIRTSEDNPNMLNDLYN